MTVTITRLLIRVHTAVARTRTAVKMPRNASSSVFLTFSSFTKGKKESLYACWVHLQIMSKLDW